MSYMPCMSYMSYMPCMSYTACMPYMSYMPYMPVCTYALSLASFAAWSAAMQLSTISSMSPLRILSSR